MAVRPAALRSPCITYFRSLSAAGFAATAISFGPARMGFGLFVPEIEDGITLGSSMVGNISSGGFVGYFLGLLAAQLLLTRAGPLAPVLTGLVAATIGMALVASAGDAWLLALGVFLAASSAGLAWTPFNDAVHRKIYGVNRPDALSRISTGTALGIAAAGSAGLASAAFGVSWRIAWAGFVATAALAALGNWMALRPVERPPVDPTEPGWRDLLTRGALPIFACSAVFGIVSAIFIAFAASHLRHAGGLPGLDAALVPGLIYVAYGLFGLLGLATARITDIVGTAWLVRLLMASGAASLALLTLAPGSWAGVIAAAGLQGVHVMMMSAVLAFWSERLFTAAPALGFTAVLVASAVGSIAGPAIAGAVAETTGTGAMFLGTAILPALAAILLVSGAVRLVPPSPAWSEG